MLSLEIKKARRSIKSLIFKLCITLLVPFLHYKIQELCLQLPFDISLIPIALFADDLCVKGTNISKIQRIIEISEFCQQFFHLQFNAANTQFVSMLPSASASSSTFVLNNQFPLQIADSKIQNSSQAKYLGLTINEFGGFKQSVESLQAKLEKFECIFKNIINTTKIADPFILQPTYRQMVLQPAIYGIEIWGVYYFKDFLRSFIDKIRDKYILNFLKSSLHISPHIPHILLCKELNWLPVNVQLLEKLAYSWNLLLLKPQEDYLYKVLKMHINMPRRSKYSNFTWLNAVAEIFENHYCSMNIASFQSIDLHRLKSEMRIKLNEQFQAQRSVFSPVSIYKQFQTPWTSPTNVEQFNLSPQQLRTLLYFRLSQFLKFHYVNQNYLKDTAIPDKCSFYYECPLCQAGLETLSHILLECPAYEHFKAKYKDKILLDLSSVNALISLSPLQSLIKYLEEVRQYREDSIQIFSIEPFLPNPYVIEFSSVVVNFEIYRLEFDGGFIQYDNIASASALLFNSNNNLIASDSFIGENFTNDIFEFIGQIIGLQIAKKLICKSCIFSAIPNL